MFEATGQIEVGALALWENQAIRSSLVFSFIIPTRRRSVTVKHDGQCSKIEKMDDGIHVYRRFVLVILTFLALTICYE